MKLIVSLSIAVLLFAQITFAQTSVGIGTSTPNSKALLDLTSTNKGLLIPRTTTALRTGIPTPPPGMIMYDTDLDLFFYYSATDGWIRLLTNMVWNKHPSRNFIYSNVDSVGIGVSFLSEKFQVSNGNIYVQDNRTNKNPHVIFDVPAVDYNEGGLQWKRSGDTLAAINYIEDPNLANYIRLGSGGAGKGNDLTINTSGEVGIGTANPLGQLHLAPYTGDNLVIRDVDGTIQFTKPPTTIGGVDEKKGFLQITDTDDLRLGTNSSNAFGKVIIRTNGTDQVTVDAQGEVGIGTATPFTKLHIVGGEDAGLSNTTNGYAMIGVTTSSSNLIIDNNEIMVRNGYLAGTLTLQNDGGQVSVGARTTFNVDGEAIKLNGASPNIGFYYNNVYHGFISQETADLFIGVNGGKLHLDATQIAIGNVKNTADAYKLAVTGKIICEEIRIKLNTAWPDYVFDEEYKMPTLADLGQFVKTNKHLPNIPAASQIEKEGHDVGLMQKRMMEKIEELTLYILQQQEQINELKGRLK